MKNKNKIPPSAPSEPTSNSLGTVQWLPGMLRAVDVALDSIVRGPAGLPAIRTVELSALIAEKSGYNAVCEALKAWDKAIFPITSSERAALRSQTTVALRKARGE